MSQESGTVFKRIFGLGNKRYLLMTMQPMPVLPVVRLAFLPTISDTSTPRTHQFCLYSTVTIRTSFDDHSRCLRIKTEACISLLKLDIGQQIS